MTNSRHSAAGRRVLVIEERAHLPQGHFPNRFMELAHGFEECGTEVTALTSRGWCGEPSPAETAIDVHQFSSTALKVLAVGWRAGRSGRLGRSIDNVLRAAVLASQVRRVARRTGNIDLVVIVGTTAQVSLLPLFVGRSRSRHWLAHVFTPPLFVPGRRAVALARLNAYMTRRGTVTIVTPTPEWSEPYRVLGLATLSLPLAGARPTVPIPDAAAQLGLRTGPRIALLFGASHKEKDPGVVANALRSSSEWQLLVVGKIAAAPDFTTGHWANPPVLVPGIVDATTRALAYEAADVVVLSFVPGYRRNSGTLMDALAHSKPVIASDESLAADLTAQHGVGVAFRSGDPESLRSALEQMGHQSSPEAIAAAQRALSNSSVARQHLDAVGL